MSRDEAVPGQSRQRFRADTEETRSLLRVNIGFRDYCSCPSNGWFKLHRRDLKAPQICVSSFKAPSHLRQMLGAAVHTSVRQEPLWLEIHFGLNFATVRELRILEGPRFVGSNFGHLPSDAQDAEKRYTLRL